MNVVIIGAGVSGLSAANYLVDHGIKPIIIDADKVGKVKVCGEFFSYETIHFLKRWGIPFIEIKKANFNTMSGSYSFNLPFSCASSSRAICEELLASRAISLGAKLYDNSYVKEIIPPNSAKDVSYIKTSNAEFIADKLIITTSRLPCFDSSKANNAQYIGIKAHFKNITMPNELNMYMIPGAYMGITNITESTTNVCCLAKKSLVDKFDNVDLFMDYFFGSISDLKNIYFRSLGNTDSWLTTQINVFGKKNVPLWNNSYFIGDSIASIYPASGNGLAMGLTSGVMAAEHIIKNSNSNFNNKWDSRYSSRLQYAKILHSLFMAGKKADIAFKIGNLVPGALNFFYRFTRDK